MEKEKIIHKRFPADTSLKNEDVVTFLSDKRINGEMYAYFQKISQVDDNKNTYFLKKDLGKQIELAKKFNCGTTRTYRNHFNYLIEKEYLIPDEKDKNKYYLPKKENIYLLIPLETVEFLTNNCKEHVIKIYIYLGQRFKYSQEVLKRPYTFTLKELGEHIGITVENNVKNATKVRNVLELLENVGLISYEHIYDGIVPKHQLNEYSFLYKSKK